MTNIKIKNNISHNSLILRNANKHEKYNGHQNTISSTIQPSFLKQPQIREKCNNFIAHNKKNLKNFFKDRIPQQEHKIQQKPIVFSPTKIFRMRQEQLSKQQATKIKFHNSIDFSDLFEATPLAKKITDCFTNSSKSRQQNKKIEKQINKISNIKKSYSIASKYTIVDQTKGVRRCFTLKNQSQNKMQNNDSFSIQKNTSEHKISQHIVSPQVDIKRKNKYRPKTQNCTRNQQQKQRQNLNNMTTKLQDFYSKINPNGLQFITRNKNRALTAFEQNEDKHENQILQWVKNASESCKKKNITNNKIRSIQDLEKIDAKFYQKMTAHKKNRLQIRKQALNSIVLTQTCAVNRMEFMESPRKQCNMTLDQSLISSSRDQQNNFVIKNQFYLYKKCINPQVNIQVQKFTNFGKFLIGSLNIAKLYNIKLQDIYNVLWKKRKPFQHEGSYVLFKLIKNNNFQVFCKFTNRNRQYLHQFDYEYRTCLIYAVQKQCFEIVKFIIKQGVNIDFQDSTGATALVYALKMKNYPLIQILLQAGASPWSTSNFNINYLVSKCDDKKIKIAIKNSRKVQIARSLIFKIKDKDQFWNLYSKKIQGDQIIKFQ